MIVYCVMFGPGEPDGVYTLAICATQERAEQEIARLFASYNSSFYDNENLWIEEEEVLE